MTKTGVRYITARSLVLQYFFSEAGYERFSQPAGLDKSTRASAPLLQNHQRLPEIGNIRHDESNQATASIAANIAEGCGKRGNGEFQRFLGIAAGSASEVEYHFLLARDLGFLRDEQYKFLDSAIVEIKRMLASLIIKVESERRAG